MIRISVTRTINAPADLVFTTISAISDLPNVVPDITNVEFLSEIKSGVGTRFIETRVVNGKENTTELEVTEFVENERIRMVTDSHGTIWDSIFTVHSAGSKTELMLTMDARANKFLPKIMNPLLKGIFKKGLEKHMDALKTYCEK
jgi:uncharacterized protein YndB with AHSA1/START domain